MSGERAFVSGGTGFVGANVIRALLEEGREVHALARPGSDRSNLPESDGLRVFEGDLTRFESLLPAIRGCSEVYHVAADYRFWARDPSELARNNVEGTENVMRAAEEEGASRVVYTSTVGTIGLSSQPTPADEATPALTDQYVIPYKRTKFAAEEVARRYARRGLPLVIVNPSTPIGAWDRKPTPTGRMLVDFLNGKLPAYVRTGLNFIHVRDVAAGHLRAARRGRVGERYILGNRNMTMREFLEILANESGESAPRLRIPYALAWAAGAASTAWSRVTAREPSIALDAVRMSRHTMYFDPGKAVRELGLPQTPLVEAIREAIDWFRRIGLVNRLQQRR